MSTQRLALLIEIQYSLQHQQQQKTFIYFENHRFVYLDFDLNSPWFVDTSTRECVYFRFLQNVVARGKTQKNVIIMDVVILLEAGER